MKTVSIIIPVYNVAPYIRRCLDSVCQQTYQSIECILVDDCSTDSSMAIVDEYLAAYQGDIRFIVLHHQHNSGQSTARNTGMNAASGKYVFFLDSDDALTPDCMMTLLELSNKYQEADLVQGNTVADKDGSLMPYRFNTHAPEFCDNKNTIEKLILADLTKTVWNRLIKRDFLTEHHIYFPDGIVYEDTYWIYFLAKSVKAAAFTNTGTYLYYKNKNSEVNSTSRQSYLKHYRSQMYNSEAFFKDLKSSTHASVYLRQYFSGNLVATMTDLCALHSLRYWMEFWRLVCRTAIHFFTKTTFHRVLLFLLLMPPFCFLAGYKGWLWRIKQYIVSKT